MTLPTVKFPAIGFGRPDDIFKHGWLQGFLDEDKMKVCAEPGAQRDSARGMEIVDSAGRCWEVVDTRYTERKRNFWQRMFDPRMFDLEMTLEARGATTLDAVKERICALIQVDDPLNWIDEELAAGESGEPVEDDVQIKRVIAKVKKARTVAALLKMFDLVDPIY